MNERIKELEKQCTEQQIDYDVGKVYDQVDHRKMAELIVRECMSTLYLHGYDDAMNKIKEHFGVEE